MKRHRYRQEALPLPDSQPKDYSPSPQQLAGPTQGWLPFGDGAQLGPLFDIDCQGQQAPPQPAG